VVSATGVVLPGEAAEAEAAMQAALAVGDTSREPSGSGGSSAQAIDDALASLARRLHKAREQFRSSREERKSESESDDGVGHATLEEAGRRAVRGVTSASDELEIEACRRQLAKLLVLRSALPCDDSGWPLIVPPPFDGEQALADVVGGNSGSGRRKERGRGCLAAGAPGLRAALEGLLGVVPAGDAMNVQQQAGTGPWTELVAQAFRACSAGAAHEGSSAVEIAGAASGEEHAQGPAWVSLFPGLNCSLDEGSID